MKLFVSSNFRHEFYWETNRLQTVRNICEAFKSAVYKCSVLGVFGVPVLCYWGAQSSWIYCFVKLEAKTLIVTSDYMLKMPEWSTRLSVYVRMAYTPFSIQLCGNNMAQFLTCLLNLYFRYLWTTRSIDVKWFPNQIRETCALQYKSHNFFVADTRSFLAVFHLIHIEWFTLWNPCKSQLCSNRHYWCAILFQRCCGITVETPFSTSDWNFLAFAVIGTIYRWVFGAVKWSFMPIQDMLL